MIGSCVNEGCATVITVRNVSQCQILVGLFFIAKKLRMAQRSLESNAVSLNTRPGAKYEMLHCLYYSFHCMIAYQY